MPIFGHNYGFREENKRFLEDFNNTFLHTFEFLLRIYQIRAPERGF